MKIKIKGANIIMQNEQTIRQSIKKVESARKYVEAITNQTMKIEHTLKMFEKDIFTREEVEVIINREYQGMNSKIVQLGSFLKLDDVLSTEGFKPEFINLKPIQMNYYVGVSIDDSIIPAHVNANHIHIAKECIPNYRGGTLFYNVAEKFWTYESMIIEFDVPVNGVIQSLLQGDDLVAKIHISQGDTHFKIPVRVESKVLEMV